MAQQGGGYHSDNGEAQQRDGVAVSTKQKLQGVLHSTKQKLVSVSFWNTMFVTACVIAVSLDPLFFYIPIIDAKETCLAVDKRLRTIALILRSLTDVNFVVHIMFHVCKAIKDAYKEHNEKKSEDDRDMAFSKVSAAEMIPFVKLVAGKLYWRSTLTSILAVFPMPQYLLVFFFFEMRGNGYLEHRKILNVFLLAQYLPRIYQIHLSSDTLRQTTDIWAKALFNFFLYILASHVLGAFWYFFSIQRETGCWYRACIKSNISTLEECMGMIYCESHNTAARNVTFLDEHCHISVEANVTAPFDFGIFLDALNNDITRDADFGTKLSYSFWWGLRNLSNFGTNLITSTYVWETCFAIFISVIGLLLFLYLIGNVQTFMSMETQRCEDIRNKMQCKMNDLEGWIAKNELSGDMKREIEKSIKKKLEENKDSDLENLDSILSKETKKRLKRCLCMNLLKKLPKLARMDEKVLELLIDYLKPVKHDEGTVVLQQSQKIDSMLLITEGTLLTSNDNHFATENAQKGISSAPSRGNLEGGDFYAGAEELIEWVTQSNDLFKLPSSAFRVKCDSKVEGFVLTAKDLSSVVSKYHTWWKKCISESDYGKC